MKLFKPQITPVRDGNFFANRVINIGIRFRIVLSHHHLLIASSVNSGLLIFTCNFSAMSTCNIGHLSEQDCYALVSCKPHFYVLIVDFIALSYFSVFYK